MGPAALLPLQAKEIKLLKREAEQKVEAAMLYLVEL